MKVIGSKEKGYQTISSYPGRKEDKKAKEIEENEIAVGTEKTEKNEKTKNKQ